MEDWQRLVLEAEMSKEPHGKLQKLMRILGDPQSTPQDRGFANLEAFLLIYPEDPLTISFNNALQMQKTNDEAVIVPIIEGIAAKIGVLQREARAFLAAVDAVADIGDERANSMKLAREIMLTIMHRLNE